MPWDVVIPPGERDPELGDRLRLELEAVLAFLIGGWRSYRARGLWPPEQVRAATEAYRAESDALSRFIDARCVTGPGKHYASQLLFNAWRNWCEAEGEEAGTQKAFTLELLRRGFDKKKTPDGAVWQGIAHRFPGNPA